MPPTRRSETAPRKSSRVAQVEKDKAARDQAAQDKVDAEKKRVAAEERKKAAAKSKRRKAAAKRKPAAAASAAAKRKASADEDDEEESEEDSEEEAKPAKKARGAPKARGEKKEDEEKKDEAEADEPAKVEGGKYKIGDVVEDVKLQNEDDKEVSLAELYNEQGLVIFSYPKANTPGAVLLHVQACCFLTFSSSTGSGCTTQACNFRDTSSAFSQHSFTVLGLSRDKPTAQMSWKSKHELGYSLLSDPQAGLLKRLGATESQKRCHWIIEKGGRLLEAKIGVKPADDAKNALKFVEGLSGKKTDDKEDETAEKEKKDDEEEEK
ncbi:hypothetical protein JCM8097_009554 [Rhodosporidiobolus ruineniae]